MKMLLRSLLLATNAMLSVVRLPAIPTTVGGGFVNLPGNANHLSVEEWFRDEKHWLASSELPGPWTGAASSGSKFTLANPGPTFGIPARSVAVVKDTGGAVREVIVTYDEATSRKTHGVLAASLQKNIGVFTGSASRKQADGTHVFVGAGLNVTLTGNGGVSVRMVRS